MALLMLMIAVLIFFVAFGLGGCTSRVKQPFVDVTIVNVEDTPPEATDKVIVERPRTRVRVPREK